MKINSIKVNGFGNIENKEIKLSEKINIIEGQNESGKSTLLKFMVGMFYGISKNKRGKEISDYEKYKPWKNTEFSGKLNYTLDNKENYEIYRDFNKKNPIIYKIENNEMQDISKQFDIDKTNGNQFFVEQTKIEEGAFLSSMVSMQQEVKIAQTSQNILVQKLANLAGTGDDKISFQKAIEKLNKKQVEMVGTARTQGRPINVIEEELKNTKNEIDTTICHKDKLQEIEKNKNKLENNLKNNLIKLELLNEIKKINEKNNLENEKIKIKNNLINENNNKIEEIKNKINKLENEKNKKIKNNLINKNNELNLENKINKKINTENILKNELKIKNDLEKKDDEEKNNEKNTENKLNKKINKLKKENKRKKNIFFIIIAILLIIDISSIMLIKSKTLTISSSLAIPILLVAFFILNKQNKNKILYIKNELEKITEEENKIIEEINSQINNYKIEINIIEKNNLEINNEIKNKIEKNNLENNLEIEKIKNNYLNKKINIENNLDNEKNNKKIFTEEEINNYLKNKNINYEIENIQEIINKNNLENEKNNLEKNIIVPKLEKLSFLQEKINNLNEKKEVLQKDNISIELAKQTLEIAYKKMKENVSPNFANNLSKTIEKITNGRYNKVRVSDESGFLVENETGEYITAEKLSIGTIDQMYLSLRFAITKELSVEKMPIILDEAFAYYDTQRLTNILKYIQQEFKDEQIIIFTCTQREQEILQKEKIEYNLIKL